MPKLTSKEKKRRGKLLAEETRRDKFERLAVRRVNRAITSIRLLGNLSSGNYQWEIEDIRYIRTALNRAIEQTFQKFEARKAPSATSEFSFQSRPSSRASEDAQMNWEKWAEQVKQKPSPQVA